MGRSKHVISQDQLEWLEHQVQPDSDKIGVIVGSAPGATEGCTLFAWFRRGDGLTFDAEEL